LTRRKKRMSEMVLGIKTSFEGLHRWKDAADDVAFLAEPHRHVFNVTVEISVAEDCDRDIEFFQARSRIDGYIDRLRIAGIFPSRKLPAAEIGCERMAIELADFCATEFAADVTVIVQEDDENYARYTRVRE
jgi:hypothetical protein